MGRRRFVVIALVAATALLLPHSLPAITISEVILYEIGSGSFSEVYHHLSSGRYDAFSPVDLARAFLLANADRSQVERDALLTRLVDSLDLSASETESREVWQFLLAHFALLGDPALRSMVLRAGDRLALADSDRAVNESARVLADKLSSGADVPQGYEIEASAVVDLAPVRPSLALAESLRIIAAFATSRELSRRARSAARVVLARVKGSE